MDVPNQRSLHQKITPRTGGFGLMLGVVISWLFLFINPMMVSLILILITVSLMDDIRGLPVYIRFFAHFVVATTFVLLLTNIQPTNIQQIFYIPLLILAIVWVTNLYNFMDGSDGLAGGMAVFGFSAYAIAAYLAHDTQLALMSACVSSASLAFLLFNFNPAKIFMGDVGSIPLGFLAAAIGLMGWNQGLWQLWFPVLVFSPFIVDASVTLTARLIRREKIWQAHKSHYYQRLIQMGWTHKKTATAEYFLMLLVTVSGLTTLYLPDELKLLMLGFWLLTYIVIMLAIDKNWHVFKKSTTIS